MKNILDGLPEIGLLTVAQEVELIGQPENLALHYMREGFSYAKRCSRNMLSDGEVYSSVYESLCAAACNFKPNKIRFFSYAKPYIRGGLSLVWKSKDVVKRNKNWTLPEADRLGSDIAEKIEDADGLTGLIIEEKRISFPPSVEPELDVIQYREEYGIIEPLVKSELTDKEQSVIVLRYKSGLTFQRIGALLGSSREDIRATHGRAIIKLRGAARQKVGLL